MKLTPFLALCAWTLSAIAVDLQVEVLPSPTPGIAEYRLFHGLNTNQLSLKATLPASQPLRYTLTNAPMGTNIFGALAVHSNTQPSTLITSNFVVIAVVPPAGLVIQLTNVPAVLTGTITIQP